MQRTWHTAWYIINTQNKCYLLKVIESPHLPQVGLQGSSQVAASTLLPTSPIPAGVLPSSSPYNLPAQATISAPLLPCGPWASFLD